MGNIYSYRLLFIFMICISLMLVSCIEDEGGEPPIYLDVLTDISSLDFEATTLNEPVILTYEVAAFELSGNLTVSVTNGPFSIAKTTDGDFNNMVSFSPGDFNGTPLSVFVRFMPEEEGQFSADITHEAAGLEIERTVSLMGDGIIDPASIAELLFQDDFDYPDDVVPSTERNTDNDGATNAALDGWIAVRPGRTPFEMTAGLSFTGYTGSGIGGGVLVAFDASEGPANRQLFAHNIDDQQDEEFVGTYYMSYMLTINSVPAKGQFNRPVMFVDWTEAGVTDFITSPIIANTAAGEDPDNVVFGIRDNGIQAVSEISAEVGITYLVVMKHNVTDTDLSNNNNTAELFIFSNEAPLEEPGSADLLYEGVVDGRLVKAVALLKDNSGAASYTVDGLKISHTWEDLFK